MNRPRVVFLVAAWLGCAAAAARGQEPDMGAIERDWERLERDCGRRTIRFHLTSPKSPSGKQPLPRSGRCVVQESSVWFSAQSYATKAPQEEEVTGTHRGYGFKLSRRQGDESYLLVSLGKTDDKFLDDVQGLMSGDRACALPWSALYRPMRVWIHRPGFTRLALRRQTVGDRPLVVLNFSYTSPGGDRRENYSRAEIRLDPANRHRVVSYEAEIPEAKYSGAIDYGENDGDLPVPLRHTMTLEPPDRKSTWVCEYTEWKYPKRPIPDSELGLSAFGLPEPAWADPPARSRTWIWIAAALGVCVLALAALLSWMRRRARAAPKPV